MSFIERLTKEANNKAVRNFQEKVANYNGKITQREFVRLFIMIHVDCDQTTTIFETNVKRATNGTHLIDIGADFVNACVHTDAISVKDLLDLYKRSPELCNLQSDNVYRRCLEIHSDLVFI